MMKAIYPGSFDPVTYGHLDIIRRSAKIADELIVGVLCNKAKTPLFSTEERVKMLSEATQDLENVKIIPFSGLLIDFAKQTESNVIIRGVRGTADFDYEMQMAQANQKLYPGAETLFMATNLEYAYLSSTTVKEVASFGGDISQFVPEFVEQQVTEKIKEKRRV